MKLVTSLFAGIFCFTLGACQQMPNNPSAISQNNTSAQNPSGFEVSQVAFGGGFAAPIAAAPIAAPAPITTAPVVTTLPPVSTIRTPINNTVPIASAPIAAAPFATAPLTAAPLPAAPLPATPLAATAPIVTAPITTVPVAETAPAASQNDEPVPPLPVAPPVGPGSDIPPPGIGFGYTNTYTSTLED